MEYAKDFDTIITLEESSVKGGFGSAILELLNEKGMNKKIRMIGIPDTFIEHGKQDIQKKIAGIDKDSIKKVISEVINKK